MKRMGLIGEYKNKVPHRRNPEDHGTKFGVKTLALNLRVEIPRVQYGSCVRDSNLG